MSRSEREQVVLLVEDNPTNQRVARLILEKYGCHVDVAANGVEALEQMRRRSYDLVMMDCQMPEMDGYDATREIRRLEAGGRRTPIVAITAQAMLGDRERCLECGMDDYVTKPVRREVIREILERWVRGGAGAPATGPSDASPQPSLEPGITAALRELEVVGGRPFVVDLVGRYVRNTRQRVAALSAAIAADELAEAARIAHEIRGSSATIGAQKLATASRDLEAALGGGPTRIRECSFGRLEAEFARVAEALRSSFPVAEAPSRESSDPPGVACTERREFPS